MEVQEAIRYRRAFQSRRPDPVPRDVLERILEAARWAPNHRQTEPWRFRVMGPLSYNRLMMAAGSDVRSTDGMSTLVIASYVPSVISEHAWEDEQAAACAVYAVLLAARGEGFASHWRTPGILKEDDGRRALRVPEGERIIGMLSFGAPGNEPTTEPNRKPVEDYVEFLD